MTGAGLNATPTLAQLLEALEGARSVEKLLSDIARSPRIDPDPGSAVMRATQDMMDRAFEAIVAAPLGRPSDMAFKARALLVMHDSNGGQSFDNSSDAEAQLIDQIVRAVASFPVPGETGQ